MQLQNMILLFLHISLLKLILEFEGNFGAIFARSGLAAKRGLRPSNCVGVVVSDYRGSVIVALYNDTNED